MPALSKGAAIHGNPESSNQYQASSHWEIQQRYLPTSILNKANKERGKGQIATQKQDLVLETAADLPEEVRIIWSSVKTCTSNRGAWSVITADHSIGFIST